MTKTPCPCNPNKAYEECCKKAHTFIKAAKTAEQLMRSRYSAFVMANGEYLQKSHHKSTRPSKRENKETVNWAKSVAWIKLEVLVAPETTENTERNTVKFIAYFLENGQMETIQEHSVFVKEDDTWFYLGSL